MGINEVDNGYLTLPRLLFIALALVYAVILGAVYTNFVSPLFAYQGMGRQSIPPGLALAQILLAIMPAPFLSMELRKPSEFQVLLLHMIVYVPSIMVGYHICNSAKWGGYTLFMFALGCSLIALSQVRYMRPLRIPEIKLSRAQLYLILALFSVATYGSLVVFYGLPDNMLDFTAIYRSREDFKERAAAVPLLVNYMYWWQGVVVNPVFTIVGLVRRNFVLFALGVALEILLFAFTTLRGMLLSVAFCIFVVFFIRARSSKKGFRFLGLITVAMLGGSLLMMQTGVLGLGTRIFVQRWLAIQGQITGAFYDFFSEHAQANFGDSFLRGLVSYKYGDLTSGEVIGDLYVSYGARPIANATGNFWADAFGQFGYWGIAGATLAAFMLLWLVDSVFRRYRPGMGIMLFSTCALSLTEQGLQMMLLTGGLIPLLLIGISAERYFTYQANDTKAYRPFDIRP